jgi:hypothetical protein
MFCQSWQFLALFTGFFPEVVVVVVEDRKQPHSYLADSGDRASIELGQPFEKRHSYPFNGTFGQFPYVLVFVS